MKVDIAGRIKNTHLPRNKPLLPLFEAVVNSFQAIEDSKGLSKSLSIRIAVERDLTLPGFEGEGDIHSFTVTDTGIGFDDLNFESFFTSDTQYKVKKGGKGLGRFIWLKAFDYAEVESEYHNGSQILKRLFRFSLNGEDAAEAPKESGAQEPKTTIRLVGMRSPYKENCPKALDLIGQRLIEHCLPFFIDPNCPAISIADQTQTIDLKKHFTDSFGAKATKHEFSLLETTFKLRGLRLYNAYETHHRLLYAANFREVITEKLENYLPNLERRIIDPEARPFVYLGFIEGDYLDDHVNGERTGFTFPLQKDSDNLPLQDEITLDSICVTNDLKPFLEEINEEKVARINNYISQEAPEYRPLTRYINEFIDQVSPGVRGATLENVLHQQMYQKQRQIRQESRKLIADADNESLKPEEYEKKVTDFLERANELGKSSLATYVAHRKVILDFLEKSLQQNPETGKYPLEEVIHRIIYPMRTTSEDVPYEQQNLWIIDERLSFHWFLASDLRLNGLRVIDSDSASRPDLLIFENALTFAEEEGALHSLVIVEFKKPDRSSYEKEDPVDQVYRLIREIKAGHFKDRNGREIKVQGQNIPAYGYVICDITKQVEEIAQNKAMFPTPDNLGYYVYNPVLSAYVEVISYQKLLLDAKKRNRVLFEKLQLPTSS
jgi:hypothetical protein